MRVLLFILLLVSFSAKGQFFLLNQTQSVYVVNDADAQGYITRVEAAGRTVSNAEKEVLDTYFSGLKAQGLWSKITDAWLFIWGSAAANSVTIKNNPAAGETVGFLGTVTHAATGVTGVTSGRFNTGVKPSEQLSLNNTHLSLYSRTAATASSSSFDMGAANSTTFEMGLILRRSNNAMFSIAYAENASGMLTATTSTAASGFWISSRPSETTHFLGRNGSVMLSASGTSGSLPSRAVYVMAVNNSAAGVGHTLGREYTYWSIGAGLASTEYTVYNTLIEQLMDALNIGVQ